LARDFAGSTSTDNIDFSPTDATVILKSTAVWFYREGAVDTTPRRIWEYSLTGAFRDQFLWSTTEPFEYQVGWDAGGGKWRGTAASIDTWHHLLITYDGGATTNDPIIYVDGSSVTVTDVATPLGSLLSEGSQLKIGNRDDNARAWNGYIAEWAKWNVILTAAEAATLGKGYSPLFIRPNSLLAYIPLIGRNSPETELIGGLSGTVTGAVNIAHPRIIYPSPAQIRRFGAAAPPAGGARAYWRNLLGVGF